MDRMRHEGWATRLRASLLCRSFPIKESGPIPGLRRSPSDSRNRRCKRRGNPALQNRDGELTGAYRSGLPEGRRAEWSGAVESCAEFLPPSSSDGTRTTTRGDWRRRESKEPARRQRYEGGKYVEKTNWRLFGCAQRERSGAGGPHFLVREKLFERGDVLKDHVDDVLVPEL